MFLETLKHRSTNGTGTMIRLDCGASKTPPKRDSDWQKGDKIGKMLVDTRLRCLLACLLLLTFLFFSS